MERNLIRILLKAAAVLCLCSFFSMSVQAKTLNIRAIQALAALPPTPDVDVLSRYDKGPNKIEYIALYDLAANMKDPIAVDKSQPYWQSGVVYIGEGDNLFPVEEFCMVIFPFIQLPLNEVTIKSLNKALELELERLEIDTFVEINDSLLKDGLLQLTVDDIGNLLNGTKRKVRPPKPTKPPSIPKTTTAALDKPKAPKKPTVPAVPKLKTPKPSAPKPPPPKPKSPPKVAKESAPKPSIPKTPLPKPSVPVKTAPRPELPPIPKFADAKKDDAPKKPDVPPVPGKDEEGDKDKDTLIDEAIKDGTVIRGYAILGQVSLLNSYGEKPTEKDFIKFVRVGLVPDRVALEDKLRPTLGKPVSMDILDNVKKIIIQHYEANHHPVVDLTIPEQRIDDGIVQFIVTEGVYATLKIKGNEHFTEEQIKSLFTIEQGKAVDPDKIEQTVRHFNQNPYLSMKTILEPGTARGDTDIHVNVEDKRPITVQASIDNYGSKLTGKERLTAKITYGDFPKPSHLLSYMYITDRDMKLLHAHALAYTNYLPWNHTLNVNTILSTAKSVFPVENLDQNGTSFTVGMLYKIPMKQLFEKFTHNVVLGADFKQSNSSLFFNSLNITNTLTDVVQFSLAYEGSLGDSYGYTTFRLGAYAGPGGLTNHSGQDVYTNVGYGNAAYQYLRMDLERSINLPLSMEFVTRITGQMASTNLPSSEQLGGGGYATVRGYDEREVNGDIGIIVRNELRTKFFTLETVFNEYKFTPNYQWADDYKYNWGEIQMLSFLDYANISTHTSGTGTINPNADFLSAGIGLRYKYKDYATLNFDYGWQFKDSDAGEIARDKANSRGHIYFEAKY